MLKIIVAGLLLLLATACAESEPSVAVPSNSDKPWSQHCHLLEIEFADPGERDFLEKFAQECRAFDACVLSCIRSGCAQDIGGGCFHMCSSGASGDLVLMERAREYQDRTAYMCRRPPNNSFKPKPLRGSA